MAFSVTIDAAGRLVIPKPLRDRFGLRPGVRLHLTADEEGLHLSPDRPEPVLRERDGFLVIELGESSAVDHRNEREDRIAKLREFATDR